ncbi:HisA/HisF-related TIM barrel protein [Methylomonas methanica]|uniref:Histidine biosynthesis protein n=1 Tax=Methylomonas methanica (strain DSM 25384 / MC09) TaxID=857087 RepID=G0A7K3_METMM|nr:HisA/HisF-related TIM barrel protein [Methylomonas methanica]AEG00673.1 histidine biosynthesis protein [Methylomonas methanica MC09]
MQIIPVIDLKDGLVVYAQRGNRAHYQPIHLHSVLTDGSDIDAVMAGFLNLHPFKQFYIADLNAITGSGNHLPLIESLLTSYPAIEFWIDSGSQLSQISAERPNLKRIIGTESQQSPASHSERPFILSLDYKDQQPAGHHSWFEQSRYWPDRIIVMTLSRVGSNSGPDLEKLTELRRRHPGKQFIAAGGIRHVNDLENLKIRGIQAALLATALHNGAIGSEQIKNL